MGKPIKPSSILVELDKNTIEDAKPNNANRSNK